MKKQIYFGTIRLTETIHTTHGGFTDCVFRYAKASSKKEAIQTLQTGIEKELKQGAYNGQVVPVKYISANIAHNQNTEANYGV